MKSSIITSGAIVFFRDENIKMKEEGKKTLDILKKWSTRPQHKAKANPSGK